MKLKYPSDLEKAQKQTPTAESVHQDHMKTSDSMKEHSYKGHKIHTFDKNGDHTFSVNGKAGHYSGAQYEDAWSNDHKGALKNAKKHINKKLGK